MEEGRSVKKTEDDWEPEPPTAKRVASRALVLSAVCFRGLIEDQPEVERAEELRSSAESWLESVGALEEAEPEEARILSTPLGSLSPRDALNAGWRSEGLVILAWALGNAALPPIHQQCSPSDVANTLGFLGPPEEMISVAPELRADEELEHWTATYLTAHWRLRQQQVKPGVVDLEAVVAESDWAPLTLTELEVVDGDLALDGSPIVDWPENLFYLTCSIVQERHLALNWLLGFEALYSEVTTDT